jgi:uncharacterized protein with HEPN domain
MSVSDIEFLKHIHDECIFLLKVTLNKSKDEVLDDEVYFRAVVRSIEIIGEATKKVHPDFKLLHPQIEWRKIAATRDMMIHNYFGIDNDIVWNIITNKIPDLEHFLKKIIAG